MSDSHWSGGHTTLHTGAWHVPPLPAGSHSTAHTGSSQAKWQAAVHTGLSHCHVHSGCHMAAAAGAERWARFADGRAFTLDRCPTQPCLAT
jgi:hypothetical protein